MKMFPMILLIFVLLFAQSSKLDHSYHVHKAGEVCDYCLSAHSLDHVITSSFLFANTTFRYVWSPAQAIKNRATQTRRYYAVRGPPRFI